MIVRIQNPNIERTESVKAPFRLEDIFLIFKIIGIKSEREDAMKQ